MDFTALKEKIKLTDYLGGIGNLKKVANTGGGEWAGPCPICGGKDRFRVQPAQNIWLCHYCTKGKWRDVIDLEAMRNHISIGQAARNLGQGLPASPITWTQKRTKPEYHPYLPPPEAWQTKARLAVEIAEQNLWQPIGDRALAYLRKRGLENDTIKRFHLGYSSGFNIDKMYIPAGVVIPCFIGGALWYVKIRLMNQPDRKYTLVTGSKPSALFNADRLAFSRTAVITEGEFNAMIGDQTINDVIPVASFGSAMTDPELVAWGKYFINKSLILAVYDDDVAGEGGLIKLRNALGERVKMAPLPSGQDINDFYLNGGCLWTWIYKHLEFWQPANPSILEAHEPDPFADLEGISI